MTEFQAQGVLEITSLSGNSVTNIQQDLEGIGVDVQQSGGAGVTQTAAGGGVADVLSGQTDVLEDIRDAIEQSAVSGGGLGGGGGLIGSITGGIGLTDLVGVTSFGALVSKVSLKSLLTKIPAFTTLVGTGYLLSEFVKGDLGPEDLVQAPIKVGQLLTGGLVKEDLITGTIGAASIIGGAVQIGSLISGSLSGTALGGYLGSIGIGSVLTGLSVGTAGVGLAALLGTVALADIMADGKLDSWKYIKDSPVGDIVKGSLNMADYVTPAPLDKFVKQQSESFDTWLDDVTQSKAQSTTTHGSTHNPNQETPPDTDRLRSSTGAKNVPDDFAIRRSGESGQAKSDVNFGEPNRASQRQGDPVRVEVSDNRTITIEQARDLQRRDELSDEVTQKVLDKIGRQGLGDYY